ncbi:MmgE/PrpD family protein [Xanthobacter pseudotagetidis]|uniref:MmgE/PrpD family protein n=1 Tax=Xanthobacter pseudotagetidis TaxID=3119911 RepID=UPI0037298288
MTNGTDTNLTLIFAEELAAITPATLTERDHAQLDLLVFDYFGVAYGGASRPWIAALHRWAERYRGTGPARIIASDIEATPEVAAFVNGAAGHSFELDDTHEASMSHPGAVVIPAALAVASETGASGRDVLAAVAAGYEAMARIGIAARAERVIAAGHHPTAVFGVFGAAVAAGKLKGFTAPQITAAWGHALSLSAGSMQFSQEVSGAEVKRLHAGYAARAGVLAAEVVEAGVPGPTRGLDGRYGFLALYGHDAVPEALTRMGARGLAIHDMSFKPYACCRLLHSMIDGLRTTTCGFAVADAEIRAVLVRGPGKLAEQHMVRRPDTPMAAQYSMPFTVGAALAFGPDRYDAYEPDNLSDPRILAFADRVEVAHDAALEAAYPEHFGTEVEVTFADGSTRTERVLDSLGTPVNPMTVEALRFKARGLIGARLDEAAFERLVNEVAALKGAPNVGPLQAAVAK